MASTVPTATNSANNAHKTRAVLLPAGLFAYPRRDCRSRVSMGVGRRAMLRNRSSLRLLYPHSETEPTQAHKHKAQKCDHRAQGKSVTDLRQVAGWLWNPSNIEHRIGIGGYGKGMANRQHVPWYRDRKPLYTSARPRPASGPSPGCPRHLDRRHCRRCNVQRLDDRPCSFRPRRQCR